jgi:hypothetical protein
LYAIVDDVKYADIQKRLADMKKLLASATELLCSGTLGANSNATSGVIRVSATTTPDVMPTAATGNANLAGTASICPTSKSLTPAQKALALYNSFAAVAQLTPASVYVTATTPIVQTAYDIGVLAQETEDYRLAVAFLANPKTQREFKFAVGRLEKDLVNADDDLESNMRTFTTCQKARLDLADASLNWNDGTARLVFSREAVDRQKELAAVQEQYNNFNKPSFIIDTTKSLGQLEDAFQELPTLGVDPSALDGIVKDLGTVQTNLTKLNGSSSTTSNAPKPLNVPKPTGTKTASSSLVQMALHGHISTRQVRNDSGTPDTSKALTQKNADQDGRKSPRGDLQTDPKKEESL